MSFNRLRLLQTALVSLTAIERSTIYPASWNSAISVSILALASRTSSYCQASATDTATYSDLDSIFTPPAACLKPTYTLSPEGYNVAGTDIPSLVRGRNPSCFPKNYTISTCDYTAVVDSQTKYSHSEAAYLYSPGRCPEHYLVVESTVDSSRVDSTRALCCHS